jgi:hypothetical protein
MKLSPYTVNPFYIDWPTDEAEKLRWFNSFHGKYEQTDLMEKLTIELWMMFRHFPYADEPAREVALLAHSAGKAKEMRAALKVMFGLIDGPTAKTLQRQALEGFDDKVRGYRKADRERAKAQAAE